MAEDIKYCTVCEEEVPAKNGFNILIFLLLFCIAVVPGLFYAGFYMIKPRDKCSKCGNTFVSSDSCNDEFSPK